ncbi:MAG: permease [Candidatus Omnitrophota bacterium]|jgi:uncharacterized membrane protein YraQ (UPF0718 family)|nr:MAG: permease [Candidatus Omnitrophota bacterium]
MLQLIVDFFVFKILGFSSTSKIAGVINFFIYDSIKILALLFFMISVIGFLRTFVSEHKIKKWLERKSVIGNFFAALFGAVTPFCSCSSVPIFISFIEADIPLGVAFSFLITSPLVNEYLAVLMLGSFGWKITLAYIISGISIGVISGVVLSKMKVERYLVKDILMPGQYPLSQKAVYKGIKSRILFGLYEAGDIVRKLWLWVLAGIGIGAFIHNYIPENTVHAIVSRGGIFSVPIATLLGVPMYGSCAAIVPIAVVLFQKGFPLGTAIAFVMAVSGLSLPEAIILRRAMKLQLILIFFGITALAIIFTGYIFNFLQVYL